jgi:hypothetical protein
MIKRALPALVSFTIFACAASGMGARDVSGRGQKEAAQSDAAAVQSNLGEAEEKLARDSRAAVVAAGISEVYFDEHFALFKIFNAPGDRRVLWRFRVNGYEAFVSDTVGFYIGADGRRVDTHSIASALPAAHDITRTITRLRAERIMRSCISPFDGGAVVYQATGAPARASLVFTAASIPRRKSRAELKREEREREKREEREREEQERAAKREGRHNARRETDLIKEEDEGGGPTIFIGSVDLETGRCTKGRALAGPPPPETERRPR